MNDGYLDKLRVITKMYDDALHAMMVEERRANAKGFVDLVDVIFLEGKIPGLAPYRDERWGATIDGVFYKDYFRNDSDEDDDASA